MNIAPIDPRDLTWESEAPRFRVTFWMLQGPGSMWAREDYEVSDADVHEVLIWATSRDGEPWSTAMGSGGQRVLTLRVLARDSRGQLGAIILLGYEPTDVGSNP